MTIIEISDIIYVKQNLSFPGCSLINLSLLFLWVLFFRTLNDKVIWNQNLVYHISLSLSLNLIRGLSMCLLLFYGMNYHSLLEITHNFEEFLICILPKFLISFSKSWTFCLLHVAVLLLWIKLHVYNCVCVPR